MYWINGLLPEILYIAPVDHSRAFSTLIDEERRTVVATPCVVGLELMKEDIMHVSADATQAVLEVAPGTRIKVAKTNITPIPERTKSTRR